MTEVSTSAFTIDNLYDEEVIPPLSYSALGIDLERMGFSPDDDPEVPTYRWNEGKYVDDLQRAKDCYHTLGIVVLGPKCIINKGLKVGDIQDRFGVPAIEQYLAHREIVEPRDQTRADGSRRVISVVPPQAVAAHMPAINGLATALRPVYETIGGTGAELTPSIYDDPLVNAMEVSIKPKGGGSGTGMKTHGLHFDTDSITMLPPLLNIGTGGEFCLLDGVEEACGKAGVDPNGSLQEIMRRINPQDIRLLLHRAMPGIVIVGNTTKWHCVTPKGPQDIQDALRLRVPMHEVGDRQALVRLVPNIPANPLARLVLIEQARLVAQKALDLGFTEPTPEALRRAHEAAGTPAGDEDKIAHIITGVNQSALLYGSPDTASATVFEHVANGIRERLHTA